MIVFIVGSSRSGTTLLSRILGHSSQIHTLPELHFYENLYTGNASPTEQRLIARELVRRIENGLWGVPASKEQQQRADLFAADHDLSAPKVYRNILQHYTERQNKSVPLEHTPIYAYYIDMLLKEHPDAKILYITRDPRDVLQSQKLKWKRRSLGGTAIPRQEAFRAWSNYSAIAISYLWRSLQNKLLKTSSNPSVFHIKYEDLLADPTRIMNTLSTFLGLVLEINLSHIDHIGSSDKQDGAVAKGITSSNTNKWQAQLRWSEAVICEYICSEQMDSFGYRKCCSPWTLFPAFIVELIVFVVKAPVSLLTNMHRVKNLGSFIANRKAP